MISSRPPRSLSVRSRIAIGVTTVGGIAMLLGAAGAHDSASIPLVVIGGAWLLMGLAGIRQLRRQVEEVVFDGASVQFRSPTRTITVAATDIVEISRPSWDRGGMGYVSFRTRSDGTLKVIRLQDLFDLMTELRRVNPQLKVTNL